jgi:glucose/arabinose dehydrogenase
LTNTQQKLVLAPEYGGDGGKSVGVCAQKQPPVASFPAHWAPNDLVIYNGNGFPKAYRGSAFIAFHGSWNRAPFPQEGYNVVVQPLSNGQPSGSFVVFADGFAGSVKEPGEAAHRPTGLAVGPDGALYIADDVRGRIWRVVFRGNATAGIEAAPPAPSSAKAVSTGAVLPPKFDR